MEVHTAYWVILALAASPMPLLFLAWHRFISASKPAGTLWLILLIGATSSYVWLLLGMKFPALFGESYSKARFAIIDVNFVVTLGCSIAALWSKGNRKVLLGIACLLTTLVWSIEGAINSVL